MSSYNSNVFRLASLKIERGGYGACCRAIRDSTISYSVNAKHTKLFSRYFKPKKIYDPTSLWWEDTTHWSEEYSNHRLARQIALDLLAEIIEQGDL